MLESSLQAHPTENIVPLVRHRRPHMVVYKDPWKPFRPGWQYAGLMPLMPYHESNRAAIGTCKATWLLLPCLFGSKRGAVK